MSPLFLDALSQSGIHPKTLTDAQKSALDTQGFVLFPSLVEPASLSLLQALCDSWRKDPGATHQGGNLQLGALSARHQPIIEVLCAPKLLASAWHILKHPFGLGAVAFRAPKPGAGLQALHADWIPRQEASTSFVVTALLLLDDFTPENGSTRVVPGSHRLLAVPKFFSDASKKHPNETRVLGQAGALLVFNGHLWHSGTQNQSEHPRRALQIALHRREAGAFSPTRFASLELLGEAARVILDAKQAEAD